MSNQDPPKDIGESIRAELTRLHREAGYDPRDYPTLLTDIEELVVLFKSMDEFISRDVFLNVKKGLQEGKRELSSEIARKVNDHVVHTTNSLRQDLSESEKKSKYYINQKIERFEQILDNKLRKINVAHVPEPNKEKIIGVDYEKIKSSTHDQIVNLYKNLHKLHKLEMSSRNNQFELMKKSFVILSKQIESLPAPVASELPKEETKETWREWIRKPEGIVGVTVMVLLILNLIF